MLSLERAYSAHPVAGLHHLVLPRETLLLYPSSHAVVVLNARSLALIRVLAFWEAFSGSSHDSDTISCISVDSDMKLVVAATSNRIASWALSDIDHNVFRVHSSLVLPDDHHVTCLHNKSGLLAIGSRRGLSVHTLILENDLPTWSLKWMISLQEIPSMVRFAPSLMYIATTTSADNAIRLFSTTTGQCTQTVPHPRSVISVSWRSSQASSRDDLILYTITHDSTLRIFLPVLDSPQHLQLHAALDPFSSLTFSIASQCRLQSNIFWVDRDVLAAALRKIPEVHQQQDDTGMKRIREILEENWDLFLRVLSDGSCVVTAVANIDRRPPTLLRHFTFHQSLPSIITHFPKYLYLLPSANHSTLTLVMSPPLTSYELSPLEFFGSQKGGLELTAQSLERVAEEEYDVVRFVRTPEGSGVGVIRKGGRAEGWRIREDRRDLVRSGSWSSVDFIVALNNGHLFATYNAASSIITLHSNPSATVAIPAKLISLFTVLSRSGSELIIGITDELSIVQLFVNNSSSIAIRSHVSLPLSSRPQKILPVDPMAWGGNHPWVEHDVLLSVSESGELDFWVPEPEFERDDTDVGALIEQRVPVWRCTGTVRTGRTKLKTARCSSAKKTVLLVPAAEGMELTIWDSKESEFASGLEYRVVLSESVNDLDWTSTPDNQSILAVGFSTRIDLLCQQRMTYFDGGPGWAVCWTIDLANFVPYRINDSIWLANGFLLVGAGQQLLLYGQPPPNNIEDEDLSNENLFEYVARHNGPLPDYHPQMLLQCLLWEKVDLVKFIIVNLAKDLDRRAAGTFKGDWSSIPVESFLQKDQPRPGHKKHYTTLFSGISLPDDESEEGFSRPLVTRLIAFMEADPLPHLTPNENAHLLVLVQATLESEEQRRALDSNGLRYLISMRSFYILNRRASTPGSPQSFGQVPRGTGKRERLRYRDMLWAFHSSSQDLLLDASTAACEGKMVWSDARALGVAIWVTSVEKLRSQLEIIARNEYMAGENRDPVACSLLYFALGKTKLVHGLWRQAAWHKEQAVMLKFLANDFKDPRWKTAALKNAYALLSKRRFEYAAAFFLLGGSLKDAVNVCVKQLNDFQLAVALARAMEQCNDGPIFFGILNDTVLPEAFKDGNRYLASWAFWTLHRRDYAVRILVTPLQDIASAFHIRVTEMDERHYDDPSLALLFSQLRSKTLQAAKGSSEISGRSEFNFILQIARVFCRMGCHVLALHLVRSWSFEQPPMVHNDTVPLTNHEDLRSSSISRRSMFALDPAMRRRASMYIDMDITSLPVTRSVSPEPAGANTSDQELIKEERDLLARKAGLGNLMKTAKQDVKVPEFDMNAFF